MRAKYLATVECVDRYGKELKELEVFSALGKAPTIVDYIEAFQQLGHAVEINDYAKLIFKPTDPHRSPIFWFRVLRHYKA